MPNVNFSVPEDVKEAFNTTFDGQNKSALMTSLMREAVERAQSQQRILARRQNAPHITEEQFRAAREEGRPQVLRPASLHNNINFVAI
jgi:Glu-tRNA(Gln) amidotransferase subunit E-like FAD-binding protein